MITNALELAKNGPAEDFQDAFGDFIIRQQREVHAALGNNNDGTNSNTIVPKPPPKNPIKFSRE